MDFEAALARVGRTATRQALRQHLLEGVAQEEAARLAGISERELRNGLVVIRQVMRYWS
jgi:DNA-directed RNA polymerase specialized sigma24 family protein